MEAKSRGRKKLAKVIIIFIVICVIYLFYPYIEVGYLSQEYGKYFEEGYVQSTYFKEDAYMKPRVLRYKNKTARVFSDSKLVIEQLTDKRENIAVICYGSTVIMVFVFNGDKWVLDRLEGGGQNFTILSSATTSNAIWPYYLW